MGNPTEDLMGHLGQVVRLAEEQGRHIEDLEEERRDLLAQLGKTERLLAQRDQDVADLVASNHIRCTKCRRFGTRGYICDHCGHT